MGIFDQLSSLFSKKEQSVLGIDVGSSSIKIVQVKKKKGKVFLETYGELSLGPYAGVDVGKATNLPPEKISQALLDILKESNATTKDCGFSVPISSSLISFITLPTTDPAQIEMMVPIEARKYIPVPISEVVLDWSPIPKEDSIEYEPINQADSADSQTNQAPKDKNSSEVLIVAIHNEALNNYQSISNKSGLQSSFYEIEIFSTIRAVIEQGLEVNMILDMGARSTKLYIVERGVLRASHTINRGSQDITIAIAQSLGVNDGQAENLKRVYGLEGGAEYKELTEIIALSLDYIFYEANRVIDDYQRKQNKSISKVILTGGGVLLRGFANTAQTSFQTNVVYADPFSKMEKPAFLKDQFTATGPEFSVAIGSALRRLSELQ